MRDVRIGKLLPLANLQRPERGGGWCRPQALASLASRYREKPWRERPPLCRGGLSRPRPEVVAHATVAVSNQDEQREREGGKIPTRFLDESTHPAITLNRVTLCSAPSMPRRGAPTLRAAGIDRACAQHLRGHCVMARKMRVAHIVRSERAAK